MKADLIREPIQARSMNTGASSFSIFSYCIRGTVPGKFALLFWAARPWNCDFTGVHLTNANLFGPFLWRATRNGANLTDADLQGARLLAKDLRGSTGMKLRGKQGAPDHSPDTLLPEKAAVLFLVAAVFLYRPAVSAYFTFDRGRPGENSLWDK